MDAGRASDVTTSRSTGVGVRPRVRSGGGARRGSRCVRLASTLLAAVLATGGCSRSDPVGEPPRIDMSSDEAAARSIERVRDSLDESQRHELADAAVILVRNALGADRAAALDPEKAQDALRKVLDGKTADQVIADARAVQAKGGAAPPAAPPPPAAGSPPPPVGQGGAPAVGSQ
jgi:hypothetical protein